MIFALRNNNLREVVNFYSMIRLKNFSLHFEINQIINLLKLTILFDLTIISSFYICFKREIERSFDEGNDSNEVS